MAISPSIGSPTRASITILNELRSGSDFICINHLCHIFPRSPLILSNSIIAESGCLEYVKLKYKYVNCLYLICCSIFFGPTTGATPQPNTHKDYVASSNFCSGLHTRPAKASKGGQSIVAMNATARGGSVSRIVPKVEMVTALRTDVDTVVTEYGVAQIKDLPNRARAEALIQIAAPQFRDELLDAL